MDKDNNLEYYLQPKKPNWNEILIIIVTGFISFVSALLANLMTTNSLVDISALVKIIVGALLFSVFFTIVIMSILLYRRSPFYRVKKLSRVSVCDVVNTHITKSLEEMLLNYESTNNCNGIYKQEYLHRIDIILEFIGQNVKNEFIRYNSDTSLSGNAYSRITPGCMAAIFDGIKTILDYYKELGPGSTDSIGESTDKLCDELLRKNEMLRERLLIKWLPKKNDDQMQNTHDKVEEKESIDPDQLAQLIGTPNEATPSTLKR